MSRTAAPIALVAASDAAHDAAVEVALGFAVRDADHRDGGAETTGMLLARIEAMEPDWFALACVAEVAPEELTPSEALTYLRIVTAHQAWLEALANRALIAAAGRTPRESPVEGYDGRTALTLDDVMRDEVAAALHLSPVTAHARIEAARTLDQHLPGTAQALEAGRITPMHARVIAESVQHIDEHDRPRVAAQLESRVLARAMQGSVGELRYALRSAVRRVDPEGAAARAGRERRDLDVRVTHEEHGVSQLTARLRTEQAIRVLGSIERLARDVSFQPGDDPAVVHLGERRADALVALVLRAEQGVPAADEAHAGDAGARPWRAAAPPRQGSTEVVLMMDLPTLLGLREDPVAVLGAGGIPADAARALAADAGFRRAIIDPASGGLLDYGRRTYVPPAALRRFLERRDQVCRFPGCRRAAEHCEIDHAVPWEEGGDTSPANLGPLCTRHHQLKTHGGWSITASEVDGSCTWVSPLGREYAVSPPPFAEPWADVVDPPESRHIDDDEQWPDRGEPEQ